MSGPLAGWEILLDWGCAHAGLAAIELHTDKENAKDVELGLGSIPCSFRRSVYS